MDSREYNIELQQLFVEFLAQDQDLFVRVNNITDSNYFDRTLKSTVEFIREHVSEYGAQPTPQQVKAKTGVELNGLGDKIDHRHKEWFVDEYENFCKHKALESAILGSTDLLEQGEFGAVEKMIKDAVGIGLAKHMGTDYWANPVERIEKVRNARGGTSTGWTEIDKNYMVDLIEAN